MNITKNNVIFNIALSTYLGDKGESLQDLEEYTWNNFESHGPYISKDDIQYIEKDDAIDYLRKKVKITKSELELFKDDINQSLLSAMSDAKDQSYRDEWIREYIKQLYEQIIKDLPGDTTLETEFFNKDNEINFDIFEDKHFKVHVNKNQAIKDQKENSGNTYDDYTEEEILQEYEDDFLTCDMQELNTEHIDYYGTLGDFDAWLDYFRDNNEIEFIIEDYREDEEEKKTSPERLKKDINALNDQAIAILKNHAKNATLKNNINRNLQSIKKIVEN